MTDQPRWYHLDFIRRMSTAERLLAGGIAVVGVTGLMLIGDGLYMKAKAALSQVLLERSFADRLAGNANSKPWPWADFVTEAEIRVPRLHRSAIVLKGASGEALAFGPAWLTTTPPPGENGTTVFAAHRDTHFRWLKDVRPGDIIEVTTAGGKVLRYRAGIGRIARWDDSGIDAAASGQHLALTTCWPFDAVERGPLRYILDAERMTDGTENIVAAR